MKKIPIGIYEKALPDFGESVDIKRNMYLLAEMGYDFLEISLDRQKLKRLQWTNEEKKAWVHASLDSGVKLYNIVLSAHRDFPFGSENANTRQEALDIMKQTIEFAAHIGIRTIQVAGYYTESNEVSNNDSKKRFIEGLYHSVESAKQSGVMLGIENVDKDIISLEQIREIIEEINSPWLKMYPDIGNLAANGKDVEQEITKNIHHLVGIHLKDVKKGVFRRVPYGEGIVDFNSFFKKMYELSYRGPYGLEMWNDNHKNSVEIIKNARKWMLNQMV